MIDSVQTYAKVNITDSNGRRMVATKKDDKYYLRTAKKVKEISAEDFRQIVTKEMATYDYGPKRDEFVSTKKAKRDKEVVRTVLYANPMINPFGYLPSEKGGVEPVFRNPFIELICDRLYGKDEEKQPILNSLYEKDDVDIAV